MSACFGRGSVEQGALGPGGLLVPALGDPSGLYSVLRPASSALLQDCAAGISQMQKNESHDETCETPFLPR